MFNLPPSHQLCPTAPAAPTLGFCLRPEHERAIRTVPFGRLLSFPVAVRSVPLSRARVGSAGCVYSRCHLIAGRFSRVRYRSATESTESAAAATVARFSSPPHRLTAATAAATPTLFLRHLLPTFSPSFFLFLRSDGARALSPSPSRSPTRSLTRARCLPVPPSSFPSRARTRRASALFLYSARCRRATSNVRAASWWFP